MLRICFTTELTPALEYGLEFQLFHDLEQMTQLLCALSFLIYKSKLIASDVFIRDTFQNAYKLLRREPTTEDTFTFIPTWDTTPYPEPPDQTHLEI
jgi:hypothetical protein